MKIAVTYQDGMPPMNKVDGMNITYTEEKRFSQEQVQTLFLSVGWVSGEYPSRLIMLQSKMEAMENL